MKKVVSLLLALALLLCCTGLVACGGGGDESTKTTTKSTTTSSSTKTTTQASGSSLSWNDMPIYSGAGQIQKGTWAVPPAEDSDYSKFEWRYYESSAGVETVSAFYKSQMPAKGWTEKGWMEMQEVYWGMYDKNNEKDAALVWIASQEGKTVIAMWRATK
jgi:hypothetical protein